MADKILAHVLGRQNVDEDHVKLIIAPEDNTGSRGHESAFELTFPKDSPHLTKEVKERPIGRDLSSSNYIWEKFETERTYLEISLNDLGRLIGELQDQVRHLTAVLKLVDEKEA